MAATRRAYLTFTITRDYIGHIKRKNINYGHHQKGIQEYCHNPIHGDRHEHSDRYL